MTQCSQPLSSGKQQALSGKIGNIDSDNLLPEEATELGVWPVAPKPPAAKGRLGLRSFPSEALDSFLHSWTIDRGAKLSQEKGSTGTSIFSDRQIILGSTYWQR